MRSVRQYWTALRGRSVLNFNWDAIDHDSTVHVAAAEWRRDPGAAYTPVLSLKASR